MVNARSKGANGEREAAKWLQEKFKLEKTPQRNLEQVREGGFDLTGFHPFALEIKRCQVLAKRKWWLQVVNACMEWHVPVVMFRQNGNSWSFLISAKFLGLNTGFIQLEEREFILWAKNILNNITEDLI
jgi:hypothetical protein